MRRIAFLTDIHLHEAFPLGKKVTPEKNLEVIMADLWKKGIQEIVFGGDIGESSAHPYFFQRINNYPLKVILGNHDCFKTVSDYFNKSDKRDELYYQEEDEHFKYLFLDSSSDTISDSQLEWLRVELETIKKVILFIHHPVIEIDTPADKLFPLKTGYC
ncbi:MAG: hypothetical protein JWP69_1751 [Flaviaesturariibacter sp.]|nr:hypothetical protein [Flaviaesturariibacter sp.]